MAWNPSPTEPPEPLTPPGAPQCASRRLGGALPKHPRCHAPATSPVDTAHALYERDPGVCSGSAHRPPAPPNPVPPSSSTPSPPNSGEHCLLQTTDR